MKEFELEAVKQIGWSIRFIDNLSKEVQLAAIKKNYRYIKHIKDPCLEVQLEAIKQNCCAIEYIKNPCLEVQLAAVKQRGWCIQYIDNPSKEVQLEAIKQNCWAILGIDNLCKDGLTLFNNKFNDYSLKEQIDMICENFGLLKKIKNPSDDLLMEVITKQPYQICLLDNPSQELLLLAKLNL